MIQKIPAQQRHFQDFGSLKTHWLFSFSNYQDQKNMDFGTLRVFNDDIVMPGAGFPDHFHDTFEIVTIILEGTLTHTDSLGNTEDLKAEEIQRISAADGITHSEYNHGNTPIHLYQLWFYPNTETAAGYEQKKIPTNTGLIKITSRTQEKNTITLSSDASIFTLNMKVGEKINYTLTQNHGLFVYITEGILDIGGEKYQMGDQARITQEDGLKFLCEKDVKAIIIEVVI